MRGFTPNILEKINSQSSDWEDQIPNSLARTIIITNKHIALILIKPDTSMGWIKSFSLISLPPRSYISTLAQWVELVWHLLRLSWGIVTTIFIWTNSVKNWKLRWVGWCPLTGWQWELAWHRLNGVQLYSTLGRVTVQLYVQPGCQDWGQPANSLLLQYTIILRPLPCPALLPCDITYWNSPLRLKKNYEPDLLIVKYLWGPRGWEDHF